MARERVPTRVVERILEKSRRRCAFCFGLNGDDTVKRGQIARLDGNPANNAESNLAFLCLEHHDEFDSRTSQAKSSLATPTRIGTAVRWRPASVEESFTLNRSPTCG